MKEKEALEILKSPNAKTIAEDVILIRNTIAANAYLEAIKKAEKILVKALESCTGTCTLSEYHESVSEKALAQWEKEK